MCRTQKTPETTEDIRLFFGSGGGFTGFVNEYCLLKDGSIYSKKPNTTEWMFHSKIEKREADQYFKQVEQFDLFNIEFNHPANRYFFIHVKEDNKENKIIWGDNMKRPMKEISLLYSVLNRHTTKSNIKQ